MRCAQRANTALLYSLFMQRLTTKYLQAALGEKVIKASGIEAFTPQVSRWFERTRHQRVLAVAFTITVLYPKRLCFYCQTQKTAAEELFRFRAKEKISLSHRCSRNPSQKAPTSSPKVQICSSCLLKQLRLTFEWNGIKLLHEHYFFFLKSAINAPGFLQPSAYAQMHRQ